MKKIVLGIFLSGLFVSCGDSDNQEDIGNKNPRNSENCRSTASGEAWQDFVNNVKELRFPQFSPNTSCLEGTQANKLPHCKQRGIFYVCDGTTYSKSDGTVACSYGSAHQQYLIDLVKPRPVNFEAEICGGTMVRAHIAVRGKGEQEDLYQFDFELPTRFNPKWKQVWKDKRRYEIVVRY